MQTVNYHGFRIENGRFEPKQEMVNLLDTFVSRCDRLNVKMLNEKGTTPEDYRMMVRQYLLKNSDRHLAIGKEVTLADDIQPEIRSRRR